MKEAKEKGISYNLLLWAIVASILFLVLRGIRSFFNNQHSRKILHDEAVAEEENKPPPYLDASCDRTGWGKTSQWLFPFEPLLMIIGLILFLTDAFRILFS